MANSSDETTLTTANAVTLSRLWSFTTGGTIASSATVVNGTVYVGSWDGYEYALDAVTGALKWQTYLGKTVDLTQGCGVPLGQGISSTATVTNGVVYVGGGDTNWYALDATTGISLWNVYVGDNSPTGGNYNWSSPLIYHDPVDNNTYAYIGVASLCDTPLVQGKLLQVNLNTHQIVNTFPVVPTGQVGGSIWSTPAVDAATNTIYVTTGNNDGNMPPSSQPNTVAILALDATTLALQGAWQVPSSQQSREDSDWATTPILFTDSAGHQLVAAVNKGGWLYAFDRTNISAGPLWQINIAQGGASPEDGDSSVSSAALGNGLLYQAGGKTRVAGMPTLGSVRALNPSTGQVVWAHAESMWVLAPLAYANGLVVDGVGNTLEVLNAATGTRLYSYTFGGQGTLVYAAPSIANGRIYVSTTDGTINAFGLASGTKGGLIQHAGGSSSYTLTPAISGSANFGTCAAAPITNHFSLYVYDSTGTQIASSTAPSYCNWASAPVTAGQTYTIKTQAAPRQDGIYLSSWNVNSTPAVWAISGTISTMGGSSTPSIMTLDTSQITATMCGPTGTIFYMYLNDVHGNTLASATASSNCQSLTYTPSAPDMFRVKVVAIRGFGAFSGSVTTD